MPVLAVRSVDALVHDPNGTYVDVTFGGGGHSRLILERLGPHGRLLAFDQDPDAAEQASSITDERFSFAAANFSHLERYCRLNGIDKLDGLLADLGVSSHQFDVPERGFSYRFDAPLDMRMSQREGHLSAADLLRTLDADELQHLLGTYGEVRNARTVARTIVDRRDTQPLRTTGDLVSLLDPLVRGQRPRYLAQVFQALRMAVNDEIGALEQLLLSAQKLMRPGGKLVVISYHSGEDRLTKNVMRSGTLDGKHNSDDFGHISRPWKVETKKPIEASLEEQKTNPRARSARLRVASRIDEEKS